MKSKKTVSAKDQISGEFYISKKVLNPLQNIYPRYKGHHCSNRKEQRKEVKNILLPWMMDFVKTRLTWRKMPKYYHNENRITLTQHFIGRHYPSIIWKGNKQIKKNVLYKPNNTGKLIIDTIKTEKPGFTEIEIFDTLISVIYKNRIDHYSVKLKPFKNTIPVKEDAVSLWDKISERVQV